MYDTTIHAYDTAEDCSPVDSNGNTLTKVVGSNTTTYAWDFENRLTSVTLPGTGGTVSFKYDPFGRRIYKSSSSGTSVFAYDGNNLIEETNSSGTAVARYSQTDNIDEPLAMLRSGATSYYHADGLGSISSLSNAAGALAQSYTYDSFGNVTATTGSLTNPFRHTGRDFDTETNLQFSRARYYDPKAGRFVSEDPIRFRGGSDFYAYVRNSPTNYTDPDGLKTSVCCRQLHYVFGYLGLNHCYVKITQDGQPPHTYGLHREDSNGVLFPDGARPVKDDKTDTGGTCSDVGDATPCKEKALDNGYGNPNCPSCGKNYRWYSNNSNAFVPWLLDQFDMTAPSFGGAARSPGYYGPVLSNPFNFYPYI